MTSACGAGYDSVGSRSNLVLILGHAGISLGAAQLLERVVLKGRRGLDFRFLLVGSLLPDMIDKPVALFLFEDVFRSGRIMGHTLLFSLVLLGMGLWRYRRGSAFLLSIGVGSLLHLVLDEMWRQPAVLWWPVLGWSLAGEWTGDFFHKVWLLFLDPYVLATEVLGGLILAHFVWRVRWGQQRWKPAIDPGEEPR